MRKSEPIRFKNDKYVTPPGTISNVLPHPIDSSRKPVEIASFFEHRYAFFYWNKWNRELKEKGIINDSPPCLVTLDWHQDLSFPKELKKCLSQLDLQNNTSVSIFCWSSLSQWNDQQIKAAAYLNLIGDVYVHCRQHTTNEEHMLDEKLVDKYGNVHIIRKFKSFEAIEECLLTQPIKNVFFDIDLDFFVLDCPLSMGGAKRVQKFSYIPESTIKSMLNMDRPFIKWIFQRLCGFTIAIEPEHTGGLKRSYKYFQLLDSLYFNPSLFTNCGSYWKNGSNWKHLKR